MARTLTPRQAAFCRHMLDPGMTATEAARKAGYSPTYANREATKLVDKPLVRDHLAELRRRVDDQYLITPVDVLRGMHTEATLYGEGSSHSARVAAWAHLGKHLGMFTDRLEHTGGVAIEVIYIDAD